MCTNPFKGDGGGDYTFVQRVAANIIKNLEINIKRVHVRYEDQQANTGRFPFAAGVTLDELTLKTSADSAENENGSVKLKLFEKQVELNGFAVYWKPKANLQSEDQMDRLEADHIDKMFDSNIGTKENPVTSLKYLLGPISSSATMVYCPNPAVFSFAKPQVDLAIDMTELSLCLTKYQYQDFMMLLQSFEYMSRASKFRKYKARHKLENLPNYAGRLRDLWKFAFDSVYEEDVMRKINNWSWSHMREHRARCREYKELYMKKITTPKPPKELAEHLRLLEDALDEVNIRIQRQLAEREVDQIARERAEAEAEKKKAGGGFWSWFGGGSGGGSDESSSERDEIEMSNLGGEIKRLKEAMSLEDKEKLYEIIDYQGFALLGFGYGIRTASKCASRLPVGVRS